MEPLLEVGGAGILTQAAPVGAAVCIGFGMMKSTFHFLAMAPAAAYRGVDVPFLDELCADLALAGSRWRLPVEIGDLVERAEVIFWSPVTLQAPSHAVRFGVVDNLHMVHMTVTGHAANPSVHMDGVVEIDVVRGLMNADPRNRVTRLPRIPNGGKLWTEGFNLCVAVHTGLGGGNI